MKELIWNQTGTYIAIRVNLNEGTEGFLSRGILLDPC